MPIFANVFYEIAAILAVATAVGSLALLLRQPLIVAFIAVGILVGPAGLEWVAAADNVDLLAKLGIALLLFVVGLKLDLHLIRTVGRVALATGLGQVVFTSAIGFFLSLALGLAPVPALYVAVALTFSSTIIIVKLLSDKKEIDALHGRIAVGFLIVQDVVVILVMIGLTAAGVGNSGWNALSHLGGILAKAALLVVLVGLCIRFVFPALLPRLARSRELLVLFSIAWALGWAALGEGMGFSKEIGAFLAGVSLATTPFRDAIGNRLSPLRDFLLLFFFIDLGAQLDLNLLGAQTGEALILSLFVLFGNPLVVLAIMGAMGYRSRTGFLAGLTVAQISEFSLILTAMGVSLGHIEPAVLGLVTLVGLITIGLSTYLILYSQFFYGKLAPWLRIFERSHPQQEEALEHQAAQDTIAADVILFGLGRYGSRIVREWTEPEKLLAVDFDPEKVQYWQSQGLKACYGDAEDSECPTSLPLTEVRWVISSIGNLQTNLALLAALAEHGYSGRVAVTAHSEQEMDRLRSAGADIVLEPLNDGAQRAVALFSSPE